MCTTIYKQRNLKYIAKEIRRVEKQNYYFCITKSTVSNFWASLTISFEN